MNFRLSKQWRGRRESPTTYVYRYMLFPVCGCVAICICWWQQFSYSFVQASNFLFGSVNRHAWQALENTVWWYNNDSLLHCFGIDETRYPAVSFVAVTISPLWKIWNSYGSKKNKRRQSCVDVVKEPMSYYNTEPISA